MTGERPDFEGQVTGCCPTVRKLDAAFTLPKKSLFKKVGVRHIWGLTNWNIATLGCDELFEFVTPSSHFVTYSIL